jgi:HEAT repeat protein
MKNPILVSIRRLTAVAIICVATTALALVERPESRVDAALRDLASQALGTRERAFSALFADSGLQAPTTLRARVITLLRTHPKQEERIKTTLIAALERAGAEYPAAVSSEEFAEYAMSLSNVVAALQDPRAAKGLLLIGNFDGLADICPSAVDRIIRRVHEPDVLDARGEVIDYRRRAVSALGWCLQRPALLRSHPDVLTKIRRELLADLGDPEWSIRSGAVGALSALRTDPEVRAKLQAMAATEPSLAAELRNPNRSGTPHTLRYAISSMLDSDDSSFSFYVTRTAGTRVCRIQPSSDSPVDEQFIGPETKSMLTSLMCSHFDPTGQDPSVCWRVEPVNACHL